MTMTGKDHSRILSMAILLRTRLLRPGPVREARCGKWHPPDRFEQPPSGLPADAAGRRIGAQRSRLDGALEVLPQSRVNCLDGRDALADPAAHGLARPLRLIAQSSRPSSQAGRSAELI